MKFKGLFFIGLFLFLPTAATAHDDSPPATTTLSAVDRAFAARAGDLSDFLTSAVAPTSKGKFPPAPTLQKVKQELSAAKERSALMKKLAVDAPQTFLQNVILSGTRSHLPLSVQPFVEKQVTVKGKIDVLHSDDFSNDANSKFYYFLKIGTTSVPLGIANMAAALPSETKATVTGYALPGAFVADASAVTLGSEPSPASVGTQHMLVILTTGNATDVSGLPTKDKMANIVFSGNFQKYYAEQSYGKVSFTGDVTDWITLSGPEPGCNSPWPDDPDIKNYLLSHTVNLSQYDRVVVIENG
ncbi:MAG: hypothetical protein JO026_04005, partial [Patescibacteria group bacterium]|nr:hypothetical protein [Patescibacteria group bacterium]